MKEATATAFGPATMDAGRAALFSSVAGAIREGETPGAERVFAVTVNSEYPIALDEQYLLANYSYQLLFAHLRVSKGLGEIPDIDIINLDHTDIAIGFADYYFQA